MRDNLIRLRLVLEKIKPIESKLKHHVDRLVRAAHDEAEEIKAGRARGTGSDKKQKKGSSSGAATSMLAYGPNLSAIAGDSSDEGSDASESDAPKKSKKSGASKKKSSETGVDDGIYRPPKLMPVSYDPDSISRKKEKELLRRQQARGGLDGMNYEDGADDAGRSGRRGGNRALLAEMTAALSSNPYEQSSAGTGINRPIAASASAGGSRASGNAANASFGGAVARRAAELERMRTYEEENFTRLALSKKDERRRRRDEEDLALGGSRGGRGRSGQSAGFEAELGGLLNSYGDDRRGGGGAKGKNGKKRARDTGDSYEALRRAKAPRAGSSGRAGGAAGGGGSGLEGRSFEKGLKRMKQRRK